MAGRQLRLSGPGRGVLLSSADLAPLPRPGMVDQLRYMRHLFSQPHRVLDEVSHRHGPVVGIGAGPAQLAIVGDPLAIADMFAASTDSFRWKHRLNVLGVWIGDGSMLNSDGADHRRRRSAVQAGFSRRRLNGWIPMILAATDAAIDELIASLDEPATTVDLYPLGRSLVLDIVVRAICGPRLARRAGDLGELLQRAQDYIEGPAVTQLPHPFPVGRRHQVQQDRRAFDAIIDSEIEHLRTTPDGDELNVLETLVATGQLSDAEIRDQIATLIGAGYDTTSSALAWALLRAAESPDLLMRLRAEADAALGDVGAGAPPDHAALATLGLADRTVRESLRLHPPGAFGVRASVVEVAAGGHRIPPRTLIAWSPHLAGRDPRHWPDPLRFDPDRHLDPTPEQAAAAKVAWIPFGGGSRNCLGFALAQIELTLAVARFAQRLDLAPASAEVPAATRRSRPQGGARLAVTAR